MMLPVRFLAECDHEHADREPVPIARGGLEISGKVLEVPTNLFHTPLVRADVPASVDDHRDRLRAPDLAVQCRSPRPR